jgi:putative ABC transport system permease protein
MIVTVDSMENVDIRQDCPAERAWHRQGRRHPGPAQPRNRVSSLDSVKNISFIAFIAALGTAGLIILLIMVMLVRERRREIGVLKAIGAPNRTIGLQFVLEALVLAALGSAVGAAIASFASGGIASALISSTAPARRRLPPPARGRLAGLPEGRLPAGRIPRRPGRTVRRGLPAAHLRHGERIPRRPCSGHRRCVRRRHHRRWFPALLTARIRPIEVLRGE